MAKTSRCSNLHRGYSNSIILSNIGELSWIWISRNRIQVEKISWSLTSFINREMRHFDVVVVQWRQRSVQKSVMHLQSYCFTFLLFSLPSPWSDLEVPNRALGTLWRSHLYGTFKGNLRFLFLLIALSKRFLSFKRINWRCWKSGKTTLLGLRNLWGRQKKSSRNKPQLGEK